MSDDINVEIVEEEGIQVQTTEEIIAVAISADGSTAMSDLTDVDLTGLVDGNLLQYNLSTKKWEVAEYPTSAIWGSITGTLDDQTDLQNALDVKAALIHTHTESNITDLDKYTQVEVDALIAAIGKGSIAELSDVDVTLIANDKILKYNSATSKWECKDESGGAGTWGAITGTLSNQIDLQLALDAKAAVVHTHTEAQITDLDKYTQTEVNALIANSTNWDTAYGWGDHALAGYLTVETDPIFLASEAANFATGDKSKLDAIEAGAEVNVQSDWDAVSGDSKILNKPTIPTALSELSDDSTHRLVTDSEKSTWDSKSDLTLTEVKSDVDIASAISLKHSNALDHTQNTDTDLDATFEATFVKKVDTVNVLSDITSAGADIEDAVSKKHDGGTQDTAIGLNTTHRGLTSGNPHSVTPTELSLVIGTDVQAYDEALSSIAGLTYVTDSFIKMTAENVYGVRTIAETKSDLSLNNVDNVQQMPLTYLDTDVTLAADSDVKVPSQKAAKTYIDALIAAQDAMVYKGVIDASGNPNYPAADAGHTYRISVAGKIGGASGINVEVGDLVLCNTDSTASGDQATVGAYWNIIQTNLDGAVIGCASAVDSNLVAFDGITGKLIKDSLLTSTNVSDAVTKKHAQNSDTDLDATFEATFVKKLDIISVLSDITSPGADIEDAVTKRHASGSDDQVSSDFTHNDLSDLNVGDYMHLTAAEFAELHTRDTDTILKGEGELLDQQQEITNGNYSVYTNNSYDAGQTFMAGQTGDLTKIELRLYKDNSTDPLIIEIRETSAGLPTASVLATYTMQASEITSNQTWTNKVIEFAAPTAVVSGTLYAVVLRTIDSDKYMIDNDNDTDAYADGAYVYADKGAENWAAYHDYDFYFKVYVEISSTNIFNNGTLKSNLPVDEGFKIDGRDISVDGIKLDTIEESADITDITNVTTALNSIDINALHDITSAGADIEDAVTKKHTQGSDTALGAQAENLDMNSHKIVSLAVPSANGDSIRATTKITEVNLESAIDLKHSDASDHTQGTDQKLDDGGVNEVTVANVKDAVDKKHDGGTQDTAIGLNTTHRTSSGVDHSYIDQSVVSGATPVFGIDNLTDGGGLVLITSTQETHFETAYSHSQIVVGNPHAIDITDLTSYAHNSLSNLNEGDYLHLSAAEYAELHPAVTVAGAPLTLSTQEITFNYDSNHFGLDGNNLQIKANGIDETLIDWGSGANQVDSSSIPDHNGHTVLDTFNHILNRGVVSTITVSLTGGLGISWTSGELYDEANTLFVATDSGSGNVSDNQVNYLKWVSGTALTISTDDASGDEVLIAKFTVYDNVVNAYRETSLMNETIANTRRALRESFPTRIISGMVISEDTNVYDPPADLDVIMSAGVVYKDGIERKTPSEIKSHDTALVRHFHTAGVLDYDTDDEVDMANYDNPDKAGGQGLEALPSNKWVKSYFIFMNGKIGWIYPTEYFNNKAQALDAALPQIPTGLAIAPKLTAIVYNSNNTDFTNTTWQDIRAGISEESFNLVTNHNDLAGLDSGDYQHLTQAEHDELTQWMDDVTLGASGSLTLPTGQNFTIGTTQWNNGDSIDADSIVDGSTNAIITLTQETNFETAYSHSQVGSGNPHSVTPTELSLIIGTDVQAHDNGLDSLAALGYVTDSFIKITAEDTYAIRTIAETKTDLSLNNVSNVATDDTAYNVDSWDANSDAATKNAIRDQIETMLTAIGLNTAKDTNVSTTLEAGTVNATTYGITSDGGVDDIVLPEATTDVAGLLGADKWDEIVANTLAKHTQNSDTDLDTTFEATFVKKTDTVNVLSDITSAGADIEDAVTKKHTQGTDTALGAQAENLDMNTHKITGVVDPVDNQDAATKKYVDDNEVGLVWGDSISGKSGDGLTIVVDGNADSETCLINLDTENTDSAANTCLMEAIIQNNVGAGFNSGIILINENAQGGDWDADTQPWGSALHIRQKGVGGTGMSISGANNINSAALVNLMISDTQSGASKLLRIDIGAADEAMEGIQVTGDSVNAGAVAFHADMQTGFGGDFINCGVNSVEKFAVDKDGNVDIAGDVIVSGDLYTAAWTDYSGTSTVIGWSSFTTKVIMYKKVGNLVFVAFKLTGVSNAGTVTFTLPYTAANTTVEFNGIHPYAMDNGARINGIATFAMPANTAQVYSFPDAADGAWTASGTKDVRGEFWYEAA